MPAPLGGIGQQVADNLFELGKSTVQSAATVGGDVVKGGIEQITGAPSGVGAPPTDKPKDQAEVDRERESQLAKQKDKQRYEQVKAELEQYRHRRQNLDAEIEKQKNQEAQQKQQKEAVEKQEKESFVQKMLKKVGAGAHGETAKQKE